MELVRDLVETTAVSRHGRLEVNPTRVRQIMVNLVEEGVRLDSGRDGLLTELWKLDGLGRGPDPADFLAPIRVFLGADVSRSALGEATRLTVIMLERDLDERLGDQVRQRSELVLEPAQKQQLIKAICRHARAAVRDDGRSYPVLVTGPQLRYPLARLLRTEDRRLRVLSILELQQDIPRVYGGTVTLMDTE